MKRNLLQICAAVLCASLFCSCGLIGNTDKSSKKSSDKENRSPDYKITVVRSNLRNYSYNQLASIFVPILTSSDEQKFYLYDDEASYDDLAYTCILADIIVDDLIEYATEKRAFFYQHGHSYSEGTIQYTFDLINRYINYVFELPITNQIDDPQIKEIFNKAYYDTKEKPIYRKGKRYGYCAYQCGGHITRITRLTEEDLYSSNLWGRDDTKGLEDYYGAIRIWNNERFHKYHRAITEIRSGSVPESARKYPNSRN